MGEMHDARRTSADTHLHRILDHTDAVVFWKDADGRYRFVNAEFCRLVGRPVEDILGRGDDEVLPGETAARLRANDAVVLRERRMVSFEEAIDVRGERRIYLVSKFPLPGRDGEPCAVAGVATDITRRKRVEDALRQASLAVSAAHGDAVLPELARLLATLVDADWAFIAVRDHDAARRMHVLASWLDGELRENFDYDLENTPCACVVGQQFRIFPEGLLEQFPRDDGFAELGMQSYAGYPLTDAAGSPLGLIAAVSRRPLADADFVESVMKILAVRASAELARERADRVLRASEEAYRATVEAALDCIVTMDEAGCIRGFNSAAEACFRLDAREAVGRNLAEMLIPERFRTAHRDGMSRYLAGAGGPFVGRRVEVTAQRADGEEFPAELSVSVADAPEGRLFVGYLRDITAAKQAEAEHTRLEAQLRQAQKMEAIGHLAGGIAHDFNNILTGIKGYLALAAEHPAAQGDARLARYLEQADAASVRARDLIRQMLTFSRARPGTPRPVALAALVAEMARFLEPMLPSSVHFEVDANVATTRVLADPVQIEQVVMNLCINARDALGGRGRIRLAVEPAAPACGVCASCRAEVGGAQVALIVADDGPGIASEVFERIFEPFFTTKDVGQGSGMGLATVHGIVHEHGGHVLVDTATGRGTSFRVLLPALVGAIPGPVADEVPATQPPPRLAGRVLLVDDEMLVTGFLRELLEARGLQVTVEHDGEAARERIASEPAAFDLVLSDQTMPRMSGLELARALRALRPGLPVVLLTGHADGLDSDALGAADVVGVLHKPLEPTELFACLGELLGRQTRPGF